MKTSSAVRVAILCLTHYLLTAKACSIFVLVDGQQVLFGNNEDWSDPNTRVWFVPGAKDQYGCVYVGFDNHWAQGGMNTQGLAFDWVAGYKENYQPDPSLRTVNGNPSQRMLETCATVEEAIHFYQTYRETSFSYAKMLVADRSGASVILGARDGHLHADKANRSRGFGYGGATLEKMLASNPVPSLANASGILRACLQKGTYATKYSNVFDLRTGDVFLFFFPAQESAVKLNLAAELKLGEHFYDMPRINEQLKQAPRPWPSLALYQAIPDAEPKLTARVRTVIQNGLDGTMRADDFTADFWQQLAPQRESIQAELKTFGGLVSVTPVDRIEQGGKRTYRYRLEFKTARVLQRFTFDEHDRIAGCEKEDFQQ